jgi:hypothetical protein
MKKIKQYKGFKIYEATKPTEDSKYYLFAPDESPSTFSSPEWESDNLQELIDFVNCY